ncbi:RNA polymerase sigma-70 factor [Peribacillus tepidiphilus]|uniref:RNA polymerase sigma-70 factor n=1 Tax=Peribacillus tepidiphilus TaxID=2652445 RepID=UPI0035B526FB
MLITNELYTELKPVLFSLAYRMLGSVTDAEDMIQDTFLKAAQIEEDKINNVKAYLCKILTNQCINYLKSAQKKREVYVGPWLPEPVIFQEKDDPYHAILSKDYVSMAYLKLMETLSPQERAVILLREIMDFRYKEIADLLEKSEASCRKLHERGKHKLAKIPNEGSFSYEENKETITKFIQSFNRGDISTLMNLVSEKVVLYSDGGGKVLAAKIPIMSRQRVLPFLSGIYKNAPENFSFKIRNINGQPGIVTYTGSSILSVISFFIEKGTIQEIYIVVNPEKLDHIYV